MFGEVLCQNQMSIFEMKNINRAKFSTKLKNDDLEVVLDQRNERVIPYLANGIGSYLLFSLSKGHFVNFTCTSGKCSIILHDLLLQSY